MVPSSVAMELMRHKDVKTIDFMHVLNRGSHAVQSLLDPGSLSLWLQQITLVACKAERESGACPSLALDY